MGTRRTVGLDGSVHHGVLHRPVSFQAADPGGDIVVPKDPAPMDFSAWFEVYLEGADGGRWCMFDARHNARQVGRIVMAYGRDTTDCALSTSFGPAPLAGFTVHTDEVARSM